MEACPTETRTEILYRYVINCMFNFNLANIVQCIGNLGGE